MGNHSKEARSRTMSNIPSKNTKPEETVRKCLFAHGLMGCKTLFIIGNGLDLYHGVQSRYEDFHKWLMVNRDWNRFEAVEQHFIAPDLWSDLEENLRTFDSEKCGEDWSIATPLGIFINGQLIGTARELNEDFDEQLREWREEMMCGLSEWVKTLRQSGNAPKLPIVSSDAQYLNFNYTRTLEDYYGIDSCQIRHVHGVTGLSWDCFHLGYDFEVEDPLDEDEKDCNPDVLDEDRVTPVQQLNDHVRKWRKPVQELIQHNADFWESLREMSMVVVLGFSFGRVDEPYIRKISEVVRQDAVWRCSWYGKDEDVKIGKILTSVGVRNIELFRLDEGVSRLY